MIRITKVKEVKELDIGFEVLAELWVSRIDDLTTDLWGGAGPDCRSGPTMRGL